MSKFDRFQEENPKMPFRDHCDDEHDPVKAYDESLAIIANTRLPEIKPITTILANLNPSPETEQKP